MTFLRMTACLLMVGLVACSGRTGVTSAPEASPTNPRETLEAIVHQAKADAPQEEVFPLLTARSLETVERYEELTRKTNATNIPPDPLELFLDQMAELEPQVEDMRDFEENTKAVKAVYNTGVAAVFLFRREEERWKLDLHEELEPAVDILEGIHLRVELLREAKETGKPLPEQLFEDDDDD